MAVKPTLPDLPSTLVAECPDPGVSAKAIKAIADNRVYAACNKRKHRDTKIFYRGVQQRFSE